MKMFSFLSMAAAAIIIVSLGMTTLAFSKRSRDVTAQLEQARNQLRDLRRGRRSPLSWDESMRDILGQQAAPVPIMRFGPGFGGMRQDDPVRFQQMMEQRERRRRAAEQWFQDTIASLKERARVTQSPDVAEVATQLSATLAKLNDLRSQWDAIRSLGEDDRRAAAEQLFPETADVMNTLKSLRERDRQLRLTELAQSLGYADDKSIQGFVDGVTGVYKSTDYVPGRTTNTTVTIAPRS